MKTQELKYVTRRRAAVLLGISESELSRISCESGFGHKEIAGEQEETYFTYEELRTPPRVATPSDPGFSFLLTPATKDLLWMNRFRNPLTD